MPFLLSAFWPSPERTPGTMPSADFCMLTGSVSRVGAIGVHHEMLSDSCSSKRLVSVNSN